VRRPRALISVAPALVALALIPAACGGGDSNDEPAPRDGAPSPSSAGQFPPEFVECMADQGVEIEGPSDLHAPGAQQAFPACIQFLHP
jgi:hypothetical protein